MRDLVLIGDDNMSGKFPIPQREADDIKQYDTVTSLINKLLSDDNIDNFKLEYTNTIGTTTVIQKSVDRFDD